MRKLCTFHCVGKIYCLFSIHACFPISFFYQVASHRTQCATHGSVCHPLTRSSRPVSESSWGTLPSFPIAQLFLPNKRKNEVSGGDSPSGRLDKQSRVRMVPSLGGNAHDLLGSVKVLISSSIASIQETARWQFCRNTQFPVLIASLIIFSAMGPCPWPREIDCTLMEQQRKTFTLS